MFNLQGSEIIVILLLALVVLGPEKLPDAVRKFTQTYAELKKMGSGFQSELKSALDEPMREMRETANVVRDAADPSKVAAEADAEKRLREDAEKQLREDAANAQVHHLTPFMASADLPGATPPDTDTDTDADTAAGDTAAGDTAAGDTAAGDTAGIAAGTGGSAGADHEHADHEHADHEHTDHEHGDDADDADDGEARTA